MYICYVVCTHIKYVYRYYRVYIYPLNICLFFIGPSVHLLLSIIFISLSVRLSRVGAHHIASHAWITGVTSCREDTCGRRVLSLRCAAARIYGAFFPERFFVLAAVRSCHIFVVSFLCYGAELRGDRP